MSPSKSPHLTDRRRAFARIDLIVLILMLAILTAIAVPGIQLAWQAYAHLSCTNNLRDIGSAYHGFVNANKGDPAKLTSNTPTWRKELKGYVQQPGWMTKIRMYLKRDSTAFSCIYEEPVTSEGLPAAKFYVRESTFREDNIFIPLSTDSARMRVSDKAHCPNGFALELEGAWSNVGFDWNDLVITVQPQPDGSVKLTAIAAIASPYSFDLYDNYGQLLVYDFGPSSTNSYTFPPEIAHSYGMNPAAKKFQPEDDSNKVLIAEYKKPVCSVLDMRIREMRFNFSLLSSTDSWPLDCAPRHNSKLNVLFVDGSVKSLSPRDIDPRRPAHAKQFWLPTAFMPEVP